MKVQDTFDNQGVSGVLKASMLEQDLYMVWSDRFRDINTSDMPYWSGFLFIAPTIDQIEGINWERPAPQIDEAGIRKSYFSFMGQINLEFYNHLQKKVEALVMPSSSEIEMPDEALTDEQKKTKN